MSMLADRFPSRQLGFAAGFYYMGVPIGIAASLLIAGYLGPAIGWRACFYLLGGIGLLLAVGLLFLGETPRKGIDTEQSEKLKFKEIINILRDSLTQSPALVCTIAGGVAFHFILGAAAFDQLWFVNELVERAEITRHSGWLAAAGGILGNLLGGWLGDKWQQNFKTGRPMFLFWTSLLLTLCHSLSPSACRPYYSIWAFFGLCSTGLVLRANFFNRAGTCAAAHPRHGSGILHIEPEPDRAGHRHYRRRHSCRLHDGAGPWRALYGNPAGIHCFVHAGNPAHVCCRQTFPC